MNAKKITAALCAVIFFNSFWAANSFAQDKNNPTPTATPTTEVKPVAPPQRIGDDTSDNQFSPKQRNEKYRIGFQDTVEVVVYNHANLSVVANVSPDGTILMPKIDKPISVVCKTERELGEIIGTLYKSYLRNPFVTVRVTNQLSQPFAVIGAVEKPGSFYLNRRTRLLELLALAGGPKTEKAGSKIQVARIGNVSGCGDSENGNDEVTFYKYQINAVMKGDENPWMEPGDIVSILEAEEAYVVGNVTTPTKFSLRESVTLTQAIAIGGGLAPEAKTSKVRLQRQAADGNPKTETIYDLKDIQSKKVADPILQANDIVEVPKDGAKATRNKFIDVFKNSIPGLLIYGL